MPDTATVGPVTGHTGAGEEGRDGLVEEEVIVDQLILLGVGHLGKGVVLALELTLEAGDGGVKKISENFVGLLITGDAADGHDEGMSGVVHTGLNDAVEGASRGSDLVAE